MDGTGLVSGLAAGGGSTSIGGWLLMADVVPVGGDLSWMLWGTGGLALLLVLSWGVRRVIRPRPTEVEPTDAAEPRDVAPAAGAESSVSPSSEAARRASEGFGARLRAALGRSRAVLQERFDQVFGGSEVDLALLDEIEETLLIADVGMATTDRLVEPLREAVRRGETDGDELRERLRGEIRTILGSVDSSLVSPSTDGPWVILVVGVNGSGKTTTIGKLAARLSGEGRRVMLAAGDTYRAAAAEQLAIWANRAGAEIVSHQPGADPGAVVFDALQAAKARGCDVVIVDTAGRLQTKRPLMEQLSKVRRVIQKVVPEGPHETLLVLDGTMGQNGMSQAKLFHEATPLTGVVVTKLDGTAKGGMVLAIASEMQLPVKLIGIGEQVADLRDFDGEIFAEVLA